MRTRRLNLAKAIGVRLLFLLHCLLAISRVSAILSEPKFWIHSVGFVLVFLEGFHAVYHRQGMEHKWVSLGTLLFICLDIVPIWIMELDRADRATEASGTGTLQTSKLPDITTSTNDTGEDYLLSFFNFLTIKNQDFQIPLDDDIFVYAIEQSFLLVMIIGRWTLPKGRMSRDKLSNLLLVLIGKASDMTDFFTLFSHKSVVENRTFTFVVLVVWSLSVFQFPISFTEFRDENLVISIHRDKQYMQVIVRTLNKCLKTEIWGILASILMQEFPFLVCRSYAVGQLGIVSNTIIFFLFKNSLIISMYLYRLVSLCMETDPYSDVKASVLEPETINVLQCASPLDLQDLEGGTSIATDPGQTGISLAKSKKDAMSNNTKLTGTKLNDTRTDKNLRIVSKCGNYEVTHRKSRVSPENKNISRLHFKRRSSL